MQMTKHGVRDLNGPRMDGRNNGRRIQCDHHKDPSMPTISVRGRRLLGGTMHDVKIYTCSNCGEERWNDVI